MGNTCFINANLQAIFHIPCMANFLINGSIQHRLNCFPSFEENLASDRVLFGRTSCTICPLVSVYQNSLTSNEMMPYPILEKLSVIKNGWTIGTQQDAHEYYRYDSLF